MRVLLLFLLLSASAWGQINKPVRYQQEVGSYFSTTGEIPFWHQANQYGIVPRNQPVVTLRSAWRVDYHDAPHNRLDSLRARNRRVDWGWGFSGVVNAAKEYQVVIPEAYAKVKLNHVELYAGRRREVVGIADSTDGMGSYIWSGNALPLIKVQLALPEYWPVNGTLAIKGFYAHGWFNDGFVKGSLLHQKALYIRLGKPSWKVKFYGGINHQVQWAGGTDRLPGDFIKNGQFPSSLRDYGDVITGYSENLRTDIDTTKYSAFDRGNRIGNHLGTVDLALELALNRITLRLYRQSIYEDGSLFYLTNIADGLHGLQLHNTRPRHQTGLRFNNIALEYLNTYSQGGDQFVDTNPRLRGRDDYFNNGQYRDGWSYLGRTIGTPFIPNGNDTRADLPRYSYTNNNRVRVYHIGLSGLIANSIAFNLKASYSQNIGTYTVPFVPTVKQFSGLFGLGVPLSILGGIQATASVAFDQGQLYDNSLGFFVSIRKIGEIRSQLAKR